MHITDFMSNVDGHSCHKNENPSLQLKHTLLYHSVNLLNVYYTGQKKKKKGQMNKATLICPGPTTLFSVSA